MVKPGIFASCYDVMRGSANKACQKLANLDEAPVDLEMTVQSRKSRPGLPNLSGIATLNLCRTDCDVMLKAEGGEH
jgi:hypothetical protein